MVANSMEGLVKNVPTVLRSSWRPMVSPRAFSVTKKLARLRLSIKTRLSPLSLTRFGGKCSLRSASAWLRNCSHIMCYFRLSVGLAKGTRGMPKRAWQTSLVLSMWAISRSRSGEWFRNQGRFAAARDKSFVTIPVGVSS